MQRARMKKDLPPRWGKQVLEFVAARPSGAYAIQLVSTFMRPSGIMPMDHVEAGTRTVSP